ncbi:unnamed protein product [Discula destructiva]
MDTRSSSGSGSASNPSNPNPRQGSNTSQQATYTTAGTVYKPPTAPTLQPPARRGRAARWPPAATADLSVFNSSVAGGLPRSRYRSPPTTASILKHYTPLQQNHDRAVDPTQRTPISGSEPRRATSGDSSTMSLSSTLPRQLLNDNLSKSITCNDCGEQFQTMESANFHIRVSGHEKISEQDSGTKANEETDRRDGDYFSQTNDDKDEEDLAQFNNYSVKTLTNLASYPNPSQRIAQKCLDRARETFRQAPGDSRPTSRSSSRPGFDGAAAPASAYFGGGSGGGRDSSMYYSRVPRNLYMTSSTRSSVLSNGPGAPQPLTAGPPGQRQYKPSTLEGPLRALQESAQNPSPGMRKSIFGGEPPMRTILKHIGKRPATKLHEPLRAARQEVKPLTSQHDFDSRHPAEQPDFWTFLSPHGSDDRPPSLWTSAIRETRTRDEISEYYKSRPLWDYNAVGLVSVPEGSNSDLQPSRHCLTRTTGVSPQVADLDQHRAMFYEGADAIYKPFEDRYHEIRNEIQARELGLADSTKSGSLTVAQMDATVDPSQLGKPRAISVDFFNNNLHSSDAARILLGMACTTLYNIKKKVDGIPEPCPPKADRSWTRCTSGYVGQEKEAKFGTEAERGGLDTGYGNEASHGGRGSSNGDRVPKAHFQSARAALGLSLRSTPNPGSTGRATLMI